MSDVVEIRGLRALGHHGALPGEQDRAQPFLVDVVFSYDMERAGRSDSLDDAIDYGVIATKVADVVSGQRFALLEALADAICSAVFEEDRIDSVEVRVQKLRPPVPHDVVSIGVTRRRSRVATRADG